MNYRIRKILDTMLSKDSDNTGLGNGLYDIGSGTSDRFKNIWAITFNGTSTSSLYGDLAEYYTCKPSDNMRVGTVMETSYSNDYDLQVCNTSCKINVVGVISDNPGYIMNKKISENENAKTICLTGKVPVRIIGPITKEDVIVSAGNGCARAAVNGTEYVYKIGYSLETNENYDEKLVECIIK